QIEALAQGGVQVLIAGSAQGEGGSTRRIADEIDRAAGGGDVVCVLELRGVEVLDRGATGPDSEVAGASPAGGGAVASVDPCVGCVRYYVGHALTGERRVGGIAQAGDYGDGRTGTIGVDARDRPSASERTGQHGVAAELILAEGKLVDA